MKKLLAFILSAIIACCGVTALSAEEEFQLNLNRDEITSIEFSTSYMLFSPEYNFKCTTEKEKEIERICEILNSFTFTPVNSEKKLGVTDSPSYHIRISTADGETTKLDSDGYYLTIGDKQYRSKDADFGRLREYAYTLNKEYGLYLQSFDITSISFSCGGDGNGRPAKITDRYLQSHFEYTTKARNEIDYVCSILNTYTFIEVDAVGGYGDMTSYSIRLTDSDGKERVLRCTGPWFNDDGRMCTSDADFGMLFTYVYGLKTGAFKLSEHVITMPSDWAEREIMLAIGQGLVLPQSRFDERGNICRLETCQLINNLLSIKNVNQEMDWTITYPFEDVYDSSISLLYQSGIINGKSETEFCPFDLLTREEFAKILSHTMETLGLEPDAAPCNYKDIDDISDWAAEDVNIVTNAGLMQGKDDGEFKPQATLTKEEMIVTLRRLSQI